MSPVDVQALRDIAEIEFGDVIVEAIIPGLNEVRIFVVDGSFIDVWFSLKLAGRYSYHWERQAIDGTIYRHDNAPHQRWREVSTFPDHFHDGSEHHVVPSCLHQDPNEALRQFLSIVRDRLKHLAKDHHAN